MNRIAERNSARAPLLLLALVVALGAAMCVRVHRSAGLSVAKPATVAPQAITAGAVPAVAGAPR